MVILERREDADLFFFEEIEKPKKNLEKKAKKSEKKIRNPHPVQKGALPSRGHTYK